MPRARHLRAHAIQDHLQGMQHSTTPRCGVGGCDNIKSRCHRKGHREATTRKAQGQINRPADVSTEAVAGVRVEERAVSIGGTHSVFAAGTAGVGVDQADDEQVTMSMEKQKAEQERVAMDVEPGEGGGGGSWDQHDNTISSLPS